MFLKSAQAAVRGTKRKRNSADLAADGESVVREFLKIEPEQRGKVLLLARERLL